MPKMDNLQPFLNLANAIGDVCICVAETIKKVWGWLMEMIRDLYDAGRIIYLARYAKKKRVRKKNQARLRKIFQEVIHNA